MATVLESVETIPEEQDLEAAEAENQRLERLGVDLSKYPSIEDREHYREIVSKKNRAIQWSLLRAHAAKVFSPVPDPVMMTHIITTRCNYSCNFCSFADSLNAKTNELTLTEIEQTYATLGDSLNVIVYSGGETTLNKDLAEIIEAAYRLTPVKSVYIISNAWKPEVIFQITHRVMQRCPGLHLTWSLSIEGPRDHNNSIRHNRANSWDAWQNTVDAAEGLKRMRQLFGYDELDVQLCTVCSPDNVDLLDGWYEQIKNDLKPDKWNLNLMRRSVQMSDEQLVSFEERRKEKDLLPFEQKYLELTERVRQDVINGELQFLYHTERPEDGAMKSAVDLLSQEENRRTVTEEKPMFCCRAGTFGAYIGSEGEVSGCEEFAHSPPTDTEPNKTFGNLRESGYDFQEIWRSEKAAEFRQQVGQARECRGCTLESQRNYPSMLLDIPTLLRAKQLAGKIR